MGFVRTNVLQMPDHLAGKIILIVTEHFPQFPQFSPAARILDVQLNVVALIWAQNLVEQREIHLVVKIVVKS